MEALQSNSLNLKAKQFIELEGKPVLLRTIEMFREWYPMANIIITLPQDYKEYWRNYCFEHNIWFKHTIVSGGITRFHSVKNALVHVPDGATVAVHEVIFFSESLVSIIFN